ncbi:fructose-6-phosphate aldolase [Megamonas hypermegale]|uniref:fructose-6-phosphate aldolase n=1 Tax=Megamonas hypermegale TaxID=158847 RepID=UPI00320B0E4D
MMEFIIDDAHIEFIKKIYEFYPVDGVTTNPSILAKCGRQPYEVLKEIRQFIGKDAQLHVQVVARETAGMIEDAHRIVKELGENTFVKVPSVPEGFKAMKQLHAENIKITATAIYTPLQAYLAAKCGASYVAPYINRIDNMGYNGIQVAKQIHNVLKNNDLPTKVLAASFKNSQQVLELCEYGIDAATIAPDVIEGLVKNQAITGAVEAFISDFEKLAGTGKTMSNC